LHPIVGVDGNIQPCCGIHFATEPPTYDFGRETSLCYYTNYPEYSKQGAIFDGKDCKICQYGEYNRTLEMLVNKPKHERFV